MAQFVNHPWAQAVAGALQMGKPLNTVLYFGLTIFFTFFYTAITFNPVEVARICRVWRLYSRYPSGAAYFGYLSRVLYRITVVGVIHRLGGNPAHFHGTLTGVQVFPLAVPGC